MLERLRRFLTRKPIVVKKTEMFFANRIGEGFETMLKEKVEVIDFTINPKGMNPGELAYCKGRLVCRGVNQEFKALFMLDAFSESKPISLFPNSWNWFILGDRAERLCWTSEGIKISPQSVNPSSIEFVDEIMT